jgi:Holliday junction resolvase RusA-like endonuclease
MRTTKRKDPIIHVRLGIKPFSANNMHYARKKVDSAAYKEYKGTIADLIGGDYRVSPKAQLKLTLISGFSSKASDLDNTFKPLLDSMQLSMGFDDKQIYSIEAYKDVGKRGQEYLLIRLEEVQPGKITKMINKLTEEFYAI